MKYIYYNPLSAKGKAKKSAYKVYKKFKKEEIKIIKIKTINDFDDIIFKLREDDSLILVGGDGAIHYLANALQNVDFKFKIFLYKAGTGNDFARGHKKRFFEITDEIKNLPYVIYYNNLDSNINYKKEYFINGMGTGIDSLVCKTQNDEAMKNKSYFKIAKLAFKVFKKFSIDLEVDGNNYHYDDVWFCAVQNGKYFGGGMKIAPKAKREDDILDIYIIHAPKFKKIILAFPLIFIGKHVWIKKNVSSHFGKNIIIKTNDYNLLQIDGEARNFEGDIIIKRY